MCVLHQVGLTCGLAVQTMPLCAWPHRSAKQPLALLQPPVDSRAQVCQAQAPLPLPHLGDVSRQAVAVWGEAAGPHADKVVVQAGMSRPWYCQHTLLSYLAAGGKAAEAIQCFIFVFYMV